MKASVFLSSVVALSLLSTHLGAQEEEVPPNLAAVETARSRACVSSLNRLAAMDAALQPHGQRLERLNVLGRAVSLEKAADAAPFDPNDSLEAAVAGWFASDSALAVRYLAQPDSSLARERQEARTAMLTMLREAFQEISNTAQARIEEDPTLQEDVQPCEGAILVRSAALEACATASGPVCDAARATEASPPYRFVDSAEDLWNVEEYGPWGRPEPLGAGPDGGLTGAFTSTRARRGNVVGILTYRPILEERSTLSEEKVAEYLANLDSLGFVFEHPGFVMAPALEIQASLPAPLGGETLYVLHFGDLSGDDVLWTQDAENGGTYQAVFPVDGASLARLQAGDPVSLTALRVQETEGADPATPPAADAIFSLPFLQVGQTNNVAALLAYMADGSLGRDLIAIIPPGSGG